jgi:glutathione S-transferase
MMKLYYCKGACSLVVRIILNELDISFEDEAVDLRNKKTADDGNYLDINPKGTVPALGLDNGDILTENQAILQYIVDNHPSQKLLPAVGDIKRYHTLEWLNYISTELHKSMGMFFNPFVTDDIKTNILTPLVMMRLKYLNERLTHGSYLMGNAFSLPDAYLYVMLSWAHYFKLDLKSYEALNHFFEVMHARPSIIMSLKQEQ